MGIPKNEIIDWAIDLLLNNKNITQETLKNIFMAVYLHAQVDVFIQELKKEVKL